MFVEINCCWIKSETIILPTVIILIMYTSCIRILIHCSQIFWDLVTLYEDGSAGTLHIIENEFLGKGGFGFVCKGELRQEVHTLVHGWIL